VGNYAGSIRAAAILAPEQFRLALRGPGADGLRCPILTLAPTQILEKCKSQIPNSFYPNLICSISNLIYSVYQQAAYALWICMSQECISGIDVHLMEGRAPQAWACTSGIGVHLSHRCAPHIQRRISHTGIHLR
jgi:hypothetical protein